MNNKITSLVIAGCVALTTNSAIAAPSDDDGVYAGFVYGFGDFSVSGVSEEFNPDLIVGRFGKFYNDNFALETRVGFGLRSDTKAIPGTPFDATVDVDSLLGLYGVGHVNFGGSSSVYGLIGVTYAEATVRNSQGLSDSDRDSGLSLGVGADIGVGNNVTLNIEYISYINNTDNFNLNALGLGVVFGY